MPLLDLNKITVGVSRGWWGFLRDWKRSLSNVNRATESHGCALRPTCAAESG
jgi:hypothetical protein